MIKKYKNKMPKFYNITVYIKDISEFLEKFGISVFETKYFYFIESTFILKHVLPKQQFKTIGTNTEYVVNQPKNLCGNSFILEDEFNRLLNIINEEEKIYNQKNKEIDLEVMNLEQFKEFLINDF